MTFFFEIYTKNFHTGEGGWDIKVGYVKKAERRVDAIEAIKKHFGVLFDEVIQCHESNTDDLGCTHTIIYA